MRRTVLLILTVIGLYFLIPTMVMLAIFGQQSAGMVPLEGAIVAWEGDTPVVAYELNGESYTARMSISSSVHWAIGSPYRLLADPEHPTSTSEYFLVLLGGIFGATSLLLLGTGVTIWLIMGRRERRRQEILQYGLKVSAVITELKQNYAVKVNNRSPWVATAVCVHPVTREEVTLHSHMLWRPSAGVGDTVTASFDPMDDRRYALDIQEANA